MPAFEALAQDTQNRASHHVGAATTETRHFREFFGTSVLVVKRVWELLKRDSLLPEGGRPKHLLWALHFMIREFFGTSVLIVKRVWELLKRDSLLPEGGRPKHLLWALHFMMVYPKQSPGCLKVGTSACAIDLKTHRKWV
jgi:hypothetical protein